MTLKVYSSDEGPKFHALLIGIGGYEHFVGGVGERMEEVLKFGNLGQLTSPPRSALALADTLEALRDELVVPLGTVEVLISPAPQDLDPAGDGQLFDGATRRQIQDAFEGWWSRCDANAENVAFLFVSGHGVEGTSQIILASDFGSSHLQPWQHAFDVEQTIKAMPANRAQTQILLVDACREITAGNIEVPNAQAPGLRAPQMRDPINNKYPLTIRSTQRTKLAFGPKLGPSYFASAIISGLSGGAGAPRDGDWWVTTTMLASRFNTLMWAAGADMEQQRPKISIGPTTQLIKMKKVPKATLHLSCQPEEATTHASLNWRPNEAHPGETRLCPAPDPWEVQVDPGVCFVSATFSNGRFLNKVNQLAVIELPHTCERIWVSCVAS